LLRLAKIFLPNLCPGNPGQSKENGTSTLGPFLYGVGWKERGRQLGGPYFSVSYPERRQLAGYKVLNPTIVAGNRVRSQFDLLFLAKWGERRRYCLLINHHEVIPSS
jgi:hypothetical protein